ncbi:MAG: malate synthase A [Chloroflexota bacterium]
MQQYSFSKEILRMYPDGVEITGEIKPGYEEILTAEAVAFITKLERAFGQRRRDLLAQRVERQKQIDAGTMPVFLEETKHIREGEWQVAPTPPAIQKRWVEITGPTDRKMVINALNSGADVFMTDFEDSNVPTWDNMVDGQINLRDAIRGDIRLEQKGKVYSLNDQIATLLVRPRGWHLEEPHMLVDGKPMSGSLFDFGLYFFHNARQLLENGAGPYYYLAKLENHLEARLWNDVFVMAQDELGIPQGTIKATVLMETILAAFEMEEILYELREHSAGMNAGRWDYIFSAIKKFRNQEGVVFPDRAQITMTVPFMRAYTELLVRTCHKRGAHVIGGMAAFIPRKDPEVNKVAFAKVTQDKEREATDGFDGSWVAHPGLVPVARGVFESVMGENDHQKDRLREDVAVEAADLINFDIPSGTITEDGLRLNINVALLYIESWLRGVGAAALYNLMEDAATAEISRAQVWQWVNSETATLDDGRAITLDMALGMIPEELEKIKALVGEAAFENGRFDVARKLLEDFISSEDFDDFLTIPAHEYID